MGSAKEWTDKRRARAQATAIVPNVEAATVNGDRAAGSTEPEEATRSMSGVSAADGAAGKSNLANATAAWQMGLTEMDLFDASGVHTFHPYGE